MVGSWEQVIAAVVQVVSIEINYAYAYTVLHVVMVLVPYAL